MAQNRNIRSVHPSFHTIEGDGFDVQRALPNRGAASVGPFIFLDHFGPIAYKPGSSKGASSHPHAGMETLSLLLAGRLRHKDSLGNASSMSPGDIQWMRAGRGIVHDEQPDAAAMQSGQTTHGVQLWMNLPAAQKHANPTYRHVMASEIPLLPSLRDNTRARLIAGTAGSLKGPIETFGAPFLVHASFPEVGTMEIPGQTAAELAIYVMLGAARVGDGGIEAGELAWLDGGDRLVVTARAGTELLVLGGDPLDAPIIRYGPFVMNTPAQIKQAIGDFQAGRMGEVVADMVDGQSVRKNRA